MPRQAKPFRSVEEFRRNLHPTLYAATSYECAVHETVFHEIQHDADRKAMRIDAILRLDYSTIAPRRELILAALFEPDLNRWGLTRRDLIDTYASAYETTARWAKAIHDADPEIDGMVWTSRRCDPERAFVLFGDRVRPEDLGEISRAPITSSASSWVSAGFRCPRRHFRRHMMRPRKNRRAAPVRAALPLSYRGCAA